jgi:pilus assembly protein Flp/PilA
MFKSCRFKSCRFKSCRFKSCAVTTGGALRPFLADEAGTTAIEYALIASGVSIVIAATLSAVGSGVQGMFSSVSSALK